MWGGCRGTLSGCKRLSERSTKGPRGGPTGAARQRRDFASARLTLIAEVAVRARIDASLRDRLSQLAAEPTE